MNVLWFSNTPAGGDKILRTGTIRGGWLSSLDNALKERVQLSIAFYYARYADPFISEGVKYYPICKKNWKINAVKNSLFGNFKDKEDLSIYFDIINEVKPDIIHIHGTENPFGCITKVTDIPVVISIQGNCTVINHKYYSGIENGFASIKETNFWSPYSWIFSKSYNQQNKDATFRVEREKRNIKDCKNIIGRTDWDRRITRIMSPDSAYYHCDEMIRDSFFQKEWKQQKNSKLIVHSTICESIFKGFETVCQALNELNNIGMNIEWRVAGVTKNSLIDKVVQKKLNKLYPSKGLILLGSIDAQQLINNMLEADIFVMPSHIENSPNSLCEAMIIGMPCITTLAGGASSLLKDKEEGLVIQDGDPWSMAGAIIELYKDPASAIKFGQKARKRALVRHDADKIVNELLEIYQKVIEKSNEKILK